MPDKSFLGEFEQMVLLAILQRAPDAYGPTISAELESTAGRTVWEIRCMEVYAAMVDNMDQGIGRLVEALKASRTALVSLWAGLDDYLGPEVG